MPRPRRVFAHSGESEAVTTGEQVAAHRRFVVEVRAATAHHEHYWLALVGFRVHPPLAEWAVLDHENIRVVPTIGCYICERAYEPGMPSRCEGEPR